MSIIPIKKCEKCGHERKIRIENSIRCPKCGHVTGTRITKPKVTPTCLQAFGVTSKPPCQEDYYDI